MSVEYSSNRDLLEGKYRDYERKWSDFLHQPTVEIPALPETVIEVAAMTELIKWSESELHYIPKTLLSRESAVLKTSVEYDARALEYYWQIISGGDANFTLPIGGYFLIVDGTQKPNEGQQYHTGKDGISRDPFGDILREISSLEIGEFDKNLGRKKSIREVNAEENTYASWLSKIPHSRLGLGYDQVNKYFFPSFSKKMKLGDHTKARCLSWGEYFLIGGAFHPEWGNTNTSEWLYGGHLGGGSVILDIEGDKIRKSNGLYSAYPNPPSWYRSPLVGLRPAIVFPPKNLR